MASSLLARNNLRAEDHIEKLLITWRKKRFPIVHVRHLSQDRNSVFWPGKALIHFQDRFRPAENEYVVEKNIPDAFLLSPLANWLKEHHITNLVICGVSTNISVESSARTACNLGFHVTIASDACFTFDKADETGKRLNAEEIHAYSLANLQGEFAEIKKTNSILKAIT